MTVERTEEGDTMIAQLMFGIVAVMMRKSEFEPARGGAKTAALPTPDAWWKPALEVALGGLLVVVAVGARLALAHGWLN
jgi:hypothetical protein